MPSPLSSYTWTDSDGDSAELLDLADYEGELGKVPPTTPEALLRQPADEDEEDRRGEPIVLVNATQAEALVKWFALFFELDLTALAEQLAPDA